MESKVDIFIIKRFECDIIFSLLNGGDKMKKKYILWILLKKASGVPFYEIHIFYKKT